MRMFNIWMLFHCSFQLDDGILQTDDAILRTLEPMDEVDELDTLDELDEMEDFDEMDEIHHELFGNSMQSVGNMILGKKMFDGSNESAEAQVTFSRPDAEAEHDSGVGTADDVERCSLTGSSSGDLDEDPTLLDPVIDPPEIFLDRPSSRKWVVWDPFICSFMELFKLVPCWCYCRKYTSISPRDSSCSDSGRSSEFHLSDSDSCGEELMINTKTGAANQTPNSAPDG